MSYDGTIDALAGGLETFATSDFNYPRFLRSIALDTLSAGKKGQDAYRYYGFDVSCGKFMNTLLLLAMKKANKLEEFRWNIRVELSRPLFRILHGIDTLQYLHLRMHPGSSIYVAPPPLQGLNQPESSGTVTPLSTTGTISGMVFHSSKSTATASSKQAAKGNPAPANPPTISGFKNLKTLEILDMDTLEYIDEINQAITASAGTLNKLRLSMSESLARTARKPPAVVDVANDSEDDIDDGFGGIPPPPMPQPPMPLSDLGSGSGDKVIIASEVKKEHEAVLGKIFGIEAAKHKSEKESDGSSTPVDDGTEDGIEGDEKFEKDGQKFIKNLLFISKKLMSASAQQKTQAQKEALEIIERAAKKYVEEQKEDAANKKKEAGVEKKDGKYADGPSKETESDTTKVDEEKKDGADEPGLFDERPAEKPKDDKEDEPKPEDIDVEGPEVVTDEDEVDTVIESTTQEDSTSMPRPSPKATTAATEDPSKTPINNVIGNLATDGAKEQLRLAHENYLENGAQETANALEAQRGDKQAMTQYVRLTRGLQLKTLAIYLIPIRASILSKAVDLRCLKRVTLLNVGPQAAFWKHMTKLNEEEPLPLNKIHSDNVTMEFLKLVEALPKVTELFLLERSSKNQESSFAPKTSVTAQQIRKTALSKHWNTLRRLVIKNENDYSWDCNERFLEILCRRGNMLEELGISFSSKGVVCLLHSFLCYPRLFLTFKHHLRQALITLKHHLLQSLHGMATLKALHILAFRNDDTCHWVLREVRKFIVDIVSQHPEMKLEWIAQDGGVDRLIWEKAEPKTSSSKTKSKGKGKDKQKGPAPIFPSFNTLLQGEKESGSSSEGESEEDVNANGVPTPGSFYGAASKKKAYKLKCKVQDNGKFYDVWGVRMWKKEILTGRV